MAGKIKFCLSLFYMKSFKNGGINLKIVITGAKGQLGNELLTILSKGKSEIGEISSLYQDCEVTGLDIGELDICNTKAVNSFFENTHPDIVINCAAMTNVDACESNIEGAMKVNAIGPRNLAIACERSNSKLVHISTDYVFPGSNSTPYREWDTCNPNSIYGKSKFLGECYVRQQLKHHFIVRTAWLYGYLGNNFVKTMLNIGKEKNEVKVVDDPLGNPTNANDLAHHILNLALTEEYGTYHCTGNGEASWYEFACQIMKLAKLDCKVIPCSTEDYPRPAKRPSFSSLDNLALRCCIKDEMRPWHQALKSYIKKVLEENLI